MRVDRLNIEVTLQGGGYLVGVMGWDGVKGRLTHLGHYEKLSLTEMRTMVDTALETYRPGTEYYVTDGQVSFQAPLFD